jgi:hypothetical protein
VKFDYHIVDLEDGTFLSSYKFVDPGLYEVTVEYKGKILKNGVFQLLVMTKKEETAQKTKTLSRQCVFHGKFSSMTVGEEPKPVTVILSQHQLVVKHYYGPLNLLSSRLFTAKVRPRLKLYPDCDNDNMMMITNGASLTSSNYQLIFSNPSDRNIMYGTFISYLHMNIGCSTEAFSDKLKFFSSELQKLNESITSSNRSIRAEVSRDDILSSSYDVLTCLKDHEVNDFDLSLVFKHTPPLSHSHTNTPIHSSRLSSGSTNLASSFKGRKGSMQEA